MKSFKSGFLLGKFMPPSIGHIHLAGFACNTVEDMTIIVETRDSDPIPGHLRFNWMKEMFPMAKVFRLHKDMPQSPDEHPDFFNYWRNTLLPFMDNNEPDIVFASDDYGLPLANCLGARFFPLDPNREAINISATMIRSDSNKYWDYISPPAKEYFAKKVVFLGPESTGKSVLIKKISQDFNTLYVREFASNLLKYKTDFTIDDAVDSAIAQQSDIKISSRLCNRNLFIDSDTLTTKIWCKKIFNKVPEVIHNIVENENYHHSFLFSPDTPYVEDEHRKPEWKKFREIMFHDMENELIRLNRPYTIVSGNWEQRYELVQNFIKSSY